MKNGKYNGIGNTIFYYKNGKYHREHGPAVIHLSGTKKWFINDELHREDGPAIEWNDGNKEWYYYGVYAKDEEEFYNERWRKQVLLELV